MDPIQRARDWRNRRSGEQRDQKRIRRDRVAAAGRVTEQATDLGRVDQMYVEALSALPEAGLDQVGRLLYQRRDNANDLLYIGIVADDGTPQWVLLSELNETADEVGLWKWLQSASYQDQLYGAAVTSTELLTVDRTFAGSRYVRRRNLTTGANIGTFGSYGTGSGQFTQPVGIAVSSAGNIHVADSGQNRVVQFNSSRTFVRNIGSSGSGNGNLQNPQGVCCDSSNNVYVADYDNARVAVFNSTGTWQRNIGTAGTGSGQMNTPRGVAVSSAGELFVTDQYLHKVLVYTASTGAYLREFGTYGAASGQYNQPVDVTVGSDGNLYIAELGNGRVQKVTTTGSVIGVIGNTGIVTSGKATGARGVTTNGSDLYVTCCTALTAYGGTSGVKLYTMVPAGGIEVATSSTTQSSRSKLNFVSGTGISVTVADDSTNLEADITVAISPTVERVQGTGVTVPIYSASLPGYVSTTVTTASCTGGSSSNVMISGGCGDTPYRGVHVVASYPSNSTTWTCAWANYNTTTTFTMYPYVMCLRK